MMKAFSGRRLKSIVAGVIAVSVAVPALAHSPYLSHKTPWIGPDGGNWTLALINGDSILAPTIDPYRPVIVNPDGHVVAIGELWNGALPVCFTPQDCRFVTNDGLFRPDPASFGPPRAPDFYPEHLATHGFDFKPVADHAFRAYGLRETSPTFSERLWVWMMVVASRPIFSMLFLVPLLVGTFVLGARLTSRFSGARTARQFRGLGIAVAILGASIAALTNVFYIEASAVMAMVAAAAGMITQIRIRGIET